MDLIALCDSTKWDKQFISHDKFLRINPLEGLNSIFHLQLSILCLAFWIVGILSVFKTLFPLGNELDFNVFYIGLIVIVISSMSYIMISKKYSSDKITENILIEMLTKNLIPTILISIIFYFGGFVLMYFIYRHNMG